MKKLKYFDIHGHVNFPDYDKDREEVIDRARESGVGMITVGTDIESSQRAVELVNAHEDMWATVGVHPNEVNHDSAALLSATTAPSLKPFSADWRIRDIGKDCSRLRSATDDLRILAQASKVVAIGECGLDYFHSKPGDVEAQRELFEDHIRLANEVNKPLMLHVRDQQGRTSTRPHLVEVRPQSAYRDALEMIKESAKTDFNFHFFAGNIQDLKDILDAGGHVSFTGVITFTRDYDELVKYVPIDRVMSETDCPFVAPEPYRGKRCEPVHVIEVVKAIARIRGEPEEEIQEKLLANTVRFFDLQ